MGKNLISYDGTKNKDVKYHFIKELTKNGQIRLKVCETTYQLEDIFTKALSREKF